LLSPSSKLLGYYRSSALRTQQNIYVNLNLKLNREKRHGTK